MLRDCTECGLVEGVFDPFGGPVKCSVCGRVVAEDQDLYQYGDES
jgi:ribosomal protein S27E